MTKDFPNLAKGIKLQIQEAEANHKQDKPKELYIKFNQTFEKERQSILEAVSEKRYLFFFHLFLLEANYFTVLQWFLSYIDMSQPRV